MILEVFLMLTKKSQFPTTEFVCGWVRVISSISNEVLIRFGTCHCCSICCVPVGVFAGFQNEINRGLCLENIIESTIYVYCIIIIF